VIRIEPAGSDDLARVLQLRHDGFSVHAPRSYTAAEVQTLLEDVDPAELATMIEDRQLFVAKQDGRVVGCAGWKGANLRHVYVDPDETRRGIGSALVRHVEIDFRERTGAARIRAGVGLQAEIFYRSIGYDVEGPAVASDGSRYLFMSHGVQSGVGR
jgi:GNAT superfamily N-acetyltransferase